MNEQCKILIEKIEKYNCSKEDCELELNAKFSNKALEVIECDLSCILKNNIVSSSGKVSLSAKNKGSIVLKLLE